MTPRRRPSPLTLLLAGLACALLLFLALRTFMGREAEDRLDAGETIDFHALTPAPSRFLMCPADFCNLRPNAESPVFEMGWQRLRDYWSETVAHQPRLKLVAGDGEMDKITYIQRGPLLLLPDLVTIEFVPLGPDRSTFAIASRSRYGHRDLRENRQRVEAWVGTLMAMVAGQQQPAGTAKP